MGKGISESLDRMLEEGGDLMEVGTETMPTFGTPFKNMDGMALTM